MLCPSVERPQLRNGHMATEICFFKDINIINGGMAHSPQKSIFSLNVTFYNDKKLKPMLLYNISN